MLLISASMSLISRPEEKKHGRKNKIEGNFYPKQNVVVIEDLISMA